MVNRLAGGQFAPLSATAQLRTEAEDRRNEFASAMQTAQTFPKSPEELVKNNLNLVSWRV